MSVKAPLIGISAVPRRVPTGYGGDLADTVAVGLVEGVQRAGGVPVVLPVIDPSLAEAQIGGLSGLVLSGGQDLEGPLGPDDSPGERWVDPARDRHEFGLWAASQADALPVLGLCRGLQLVNVALGGELVTHIDGHDAGGEYSRASHPVSVDAGSRLAAAIGGTEADVNTLHHQAIRRLGRGLRACAWSSDGVLEAAERSSSTEPWFVGVQWHPELMLERAAGQGLFDALVAEASRRRDAEAGSVVPAS